MNDFRTGMSGACMSVKYLRVGTLPKTIHVDPLDGGGYVKYVPERTCKVEWKHIGGDVAAGYCECGTEFDRCHDYEPAHLPNFCPMCGRKVVE